MKAGALNQLSRPVRAALGFTLLASAWALWWPQQDPPARAAPREAGARAVPPSPLVDASSYHRIEASAALKVWPAPVSLSADDRFDPFAGVKPPAPPPPPPAPAPPAPVSTAPPAPAAPPPGYRFVGRVIDPEGRPQVFLGRQDKTVQATPGLRLDDGYVVEAVEADAVRLHHPQFDARASVALPVAKPAAP